MGWSTGSGVAGELIEVLKREIATKTKRARIYEALVEIFEMYDCDNLEECWDGDPLFAQVMRDMFPERYENDEEASEGE